MGSGGQRPALRIPIKSVRAADQEIGRLLSLGGNGEDGPGVLAQYS
jgi:hypothetical protein